jgi:hypothetical protein
MRALGWNCQGMDKNLGSDKMMYLARMIFSTKPQLCSAFSKTIGRVVAHVE